MNSNTGNNSLSFNNSNILNPNINNYTVKSSINNSRLEEEKELLDNNTNYFTGVSNNDDLPIIPDNEREFICSKLDEMFESIYDKNSTATAKKISKLEREKNKDLGVDLSYVYSDIVRYIYLQHFCFIFHR